jgi:beta-lactam-binding protein with PASTA domain
MQRRKGFASIQVDEATLQEELAEVGEIGERVRIAQFGMARPVLALRQGQLRKEAERVARRKGAGHPEAKARAAAASRMEARTAALAQDLQRLRVDPPEVKSEAGAGLYGRVVDAGKPVAKVNVVVLEGKRQLGYTCTDDAGRFTLEVDAGDELSVSIRTKDGAEPYRDVSPFRLQEGQLLYREIDLATPGREPCPPPKEPEPDEPETVDVPDLVGLTLEEATEKLRSADLRTGRVERVPSDAVGQVVDQVPEPGTAVRPGSAVTVTVGIAKSEVAIVPPLVGLTIKQAEKELANAKLQLGSVEEVAAAENQVGRVVAQQPKAGVEVAPGDTVAVHIGRAPDTGGDEVAVPEVVGKSLKDAQEMLVAAKLKPGEVTEVRTDRTKVGLVVGQRPRAGDHVAVGTPVDLEVGRSGVVRRTQRSAVLMAADSIERELRAQNVCSDQPQGFFATRLRDADVSRPDDLDALLARDRREVRDVLGLRTLKETDRAISALKRARHNLER